MNARSAPNTVSAEQSASARTRDASLMQAIEQHLMEHPHAADTAAGVARWWLGVRGIHATAEAVEHALATMAWQRRLRRTTLADGSVLYSNPNPSDAP